MNHYPTDEELETIEKWDIVKKGTIPLIEYIRERWEFADCGFFELKGKRILRLRLSTGGWSGNESIIATLKENLFWIAFWQKSERGGHYFFEISQPT